MSRINELINMIENKSRLISQLKIELKELTKEQGALVEELEREQDEQNRKFNF